MKTLIVILISTLIFGCSSITPNIRHDVVDFNKAVENTSNEVAFMNILRSFKRLPRHYTTISTIQGNMKVTANAEIGSSINPGRIIKTSENGDSILTAKEINTARDTFAPKISGTYSTNPTYTVGVLESQDFYRGLMRPIDVSTIALFVSQGWDPELILHLFVESISVDYKNDDGIVETKTIENKHNKVCWGLISNYVKLSSFLASNDSPVLIRNIKLSDTGIAKLHESGLIVRTCNKDEIKNNICSANQSVISGKSSSSVGLSANFMNLEDYFNTTKGNLKLNQCEKELEINQEKLKATYNIDIPSVNSRANHKEILNIEKNAGIKNTKKNQEDNQTFMRFLSKRSFNLLSETNSTEETDGTVKGEIKQNKEKNGTKFSNLRLTTRSTDGIIYYIGEYLRKIKSEDHHCETDKIENEIKIAGDPLFRICQGKASDGYVSTNFNGNTWVIPAKMSKETRSMQVLGLVQQLVNLNKKSTDLPKPTFIQVN